MSEKKKQDTVVNTNRKAYYDFTVESTIDAGIVLEGPEVKAFRDKRVDMTGAYAALENGECIAYNLKVTFVHEENGGEENRPKKLLLKRNELDKLVAKYERKGCTLIPLKIFFSGSWAKVQLGICFGKKKYDKKQAIKEKTIAREMSRQK